MAINVGYAPNLALLGQAAYASGLGVYNQNQERQALAEEELRQRERMQQTSIDANTAQQLRGIASDYVSQGRSIEAQRQRQAEQLQATELGQKRSLAAQRSNIEYQTVEDQAEKQRQRDWDENRIKWQADWEEARIKYEQQQANARQSQQLYMDRLNNLTNAQVRLSGYANESRMQEQRLMAQDYQNRVNNYDQFQYQSYLNEQRYQQSMGAAAYGSELDFNRWKQQQDYALQQQGQQFSQQQQQQLQQISNGRLSLMQNLATGAIDQQMYEDGLRQLAAKEAGIKAFKEQTKSPYPPDQQPGMIFNYNDPKTNQTYLDAMGNPVPFTRDDKGNVRVIPGYRVPQQSQPSMQPASFNDQLKLMEAVQKARQSYLSIVDPVTQLPVYSNSAVEALLTRDFPGMLGGQNLSDGASQFLPGAKGSAPVQSPMIGLPRVTSEAEVMRLPSGTKFVGPDGKVHQVP